MGAIIVSSVLLAADSPVEDPNAPVKSFFAVWAVVAAVLAACCVLDTYHTHACCVSS